MKNRRNLIVGVLVFLTLILGGIAIYVAYQVTLQQGVEDSDAANFTCNIDRLGQFICSGTTKKVCRCTLTNDVPNLGDCFFDSEGESVDCGGSDGNRTLLQLCTSECKDVDGCSCNSQCLYDNVTNGITCGGEDTSSGGGTTSRTTLTSCTTTCSDSDGCTCPSGCNTSGDINNGVSCGGTVSTGGGSTGGGSTSVDTRSVCGGKCTSNADCKPAATEGIEVTCRNGMCENAACASGKTIPGANCACGSLNACGAPCSSEVGLCQSGSTCGFLLPTTNNVSAESCLSQSFTTNQRCLPITPSGGYKLAQCGDIETVYLTDGSGNRVTSIETLLSACGQNTVVGSGTSVVCGDGICGSTESNISCPTDCGALPGTAIINDRVDAIIAGILLILLGLSLYFRVDILKRK